MFQSSSRRRPQSTRSAAPAQQSINRRQVVVVLVGLLVGALAGLVVSLVTPQTYAGQATVRVFDPYRPGGSEFGQVDLPTVTSLELQYAESRANATATEDALDSAGVEHGKISWTPESDSVSLQVRCEAKTAQDSAKCANTAATTYVRGRSQEIYQPLAKQLDRLQTNVTQLQAEVKRIQAVVDRSTGPEGRPTDANRGRLAQQSSLLTRISQLTDKQQTVNAQADTVAQNYQVVSTATVPDSPASPLLPRNIGVGAAAGLVFGLLAAALVARRAERR